MKKQQSGFTLVEIAIVMVIIGLLLGGVLKGQEVITNARIKNINNDFSGISAAIYSYQDRYRALPGDDPAADAHVNNGVVATSGTAGDGVIEGDETSTLSAGNPAGVAADDEAALVWQHLRLAGLVAGDPNSQAFPVNAFGGNTNVFDGAGTNGLTGTIIAFEGVNGDMAVILDAQNDDDQPDTGSVRAFDTSAGGGVPIGGNYVFTDTYVLGFEL